jgi:hypothetical protein
MARFLFSLFLEARGRIAVLAPVAVLCSAPACSDEAGDGSHPSTDAANQSTVYLRQRALGFTFASGEIGPPEPLAGARVCIGIEDAPPSQCTESDGEGFFRFDELPKYALLIVTVERDGYLPVLEPVITTDIDADVTDIFLYKQVVLLPLGAESVVGPPGLTVDPERGAVAAFALAGPDLLFAPASGVSVEMAAAAPSYFGGHDSPDGGVMSSGEGMRFLAGATETPGGHAAGLPTGVIFWNVSPGSHEVTFSSPVSACQLLGRTATACVPEFAGTGLGCPARNFYGYPTERGDTVRVPVRAGFMTRYAAALCP